MTTSYYLPIDAHLRTVLRKLECHLQIKLYEEVIESVFNDAENDHISFKYYVFFKQARLFRSDWLIEGIVEEYEPETICILCLGSQSNGRKFNSFFKRELNL